MDNELDRYLQMAFQGLEGFVYAPIKHQSHWEQKYLDYPREEATLKDWIRANALDPTADVYISPVVYSRPHAIKANYRASQVAWVEFDGERYIEFHGLPEPTAIVQTSSETHLHCYWRIEHTNAQSLEDINRRLTFFLQADSSGWDCTQLLRPPGTFNRKRDRPVILSTFQDTSFPLPVFDLAPKVDLPSTVLVQQEELLPVGRILSGKEIVEAPRTTNTSRNSCRATPFFILG